MEKTEKVMEKVMENPAVDVLWSKIKFYCD